MIYPVRKLVVPRELSGVPNGQVPAHLLSDLKPYGQLYWKAALAWIRLCAAARAEKLEFTHVGAYRSLKEQTALFNARYSPKPTGRVPEVTRVWNGQRYWLKKGMSPSSSPGNSNHGYGVALDMAALLKGKAVNLSNAPAHLKWLEANAERFGWAWQVGDPTNPNFEIWHLVCFDCDSLPASTLAQPVSQASKVKKPGRKERKGRKA